VGLSLRGSAAAILVLVLLTAPCLIGVKPAFSSADVTGDTWMSKAPMQVARGGLGVAEVKGKIYAIGGSTRRGLSTYYANGIVGVNEVYDPATDTWETKAPMPTPRALLRANVVNDKIYLIGGHASATSSLNEVYDPATDSWTTKAPMLNATANYASAVFDNKIYVINSNLNQIYDVENDSWSYGKPLLGFFGGVAVATTGVMAPRRIYVLGLISYDKSGNVLSENNVRVYDPQRDSWSFGADVPTTRQEFGVAAVNDILYAIGGQTYGVSSVPYVSFLALYATNEQYLPFGYGMVPPEIAVVSPGDQTYNATSVSLVFTVNKPALWMSYSLDGQDNVTVSGNATVTGLSSGLHNVTVYARDEFGNVGASETVRFSVAEPFPVVPVATASVAAVAIIGVGLLVYLRRRNHGEERLVKKS
jgi:N-acetylneuraminic acid mutarotase